MIRRVMGAVTVLAMVLGCSGMAGGAPVTLVSLESGDVACYVSVLDGEEEVYHHGDFELCEGGLSDASTHIGTSVVLTLEKTNVLADSCEGNPACTDTQEVDFVVGIVSAGE